MTGRWLAALLALGAFAASFARAQTEPGARWPPPVMDNQIIAHVLLDEFEWRGNGAVNNNAFRWDGQGWIGDDMNRLWLKSEGLFENGRATDGDQEALYSRPLLTYFDAQIGVRYDLDSNPGQTWGAVGLEGLAPYFFHFEPTFYFNNRAVAGRVQGSYDLRITQRLIVQPQFEINFYSRSNPSRGTGSGLSDLDSGIRLRYEINRKFAPYIGFVYSETYGRAAHFTRVEGGKVHDPRIAVGIRWWY